MILFYEVVDFTHTVSWVLVDCMQLKMTYDVKLTETGKLNGFLLFAILLAYFMICM